MLKLELSIVQKVFSKQMSSAVGIKIRISQLKCHESKEEFGRPVKIRRFNGNFKSVPLVAFDDELELESLVLK